MRIISQVGKTPTVLSDFSQPFNTGPLIDQNGNYTRYEILVNKPMFDYILSNTLYSKAGQKVFSGAVKFPCGVLNGPEGAIMVKSSWKVINPADKNRFIPRRCSYIHRLRKIRSTRPRAVRNSWDSSAC